MGSKLWLTKNYSYLFFRGKGFQGVSKKVIASVLAIIIGILVSFIVIGINNSNPLLFYQGVLVFPFKSLLLGSTINQYAIYLLGGLAIAFGFRVGFFNIGVPGQMLMAGGLVYIFGIYETNYTVTGLPAAAKINGAGFMIAAFLIAAAAGMVMCSFSGILKAFFNVNEVVTSIMFNYIAFYLMKWVFSTAHPNLYYSPVSGSRSLAGAYSFTVGSNAYLLPLLIALALGLIAFVLIRFTTLGYRLRAVGYSRSACQYAGINIQKTIVKASMISGCLAGIMGLIYYLTLKGQLVFSSNLLDTTGLNAIGVSLLAFNDPLGVMVVALLWGVFSQGSLFAASQPAIQLSRAMASFIFGVIIYLASISIVFYQLQAWSKLRILLFWRTNPHYRTKQQAMCHQIAEARTKIKVARRQLRKQPDDRQHLIEILHSNHGLIVTLRRQIRFNHRIAWEKSILGQRTLCREQFQAAKYQAIAEAVNSYQDAILVGRQKFLGLSKLPTTLTKRGRSQSLSPAQQKVAYHKFLTTARQQRQESLVKTIEQLSQKRMQTFNKIKEPLK